MKKVYGVGVGPGDSELVTLKALRLMRECNYIFAPKSRGDSLARSIASLYVEGKEVIELDFPMGEDNGIRYKKAAVKICEMLKDGETGVFLTIGDPMTYSTYIYLMMELRGICVEVETVPGITSFSGAASALNTPTALKGEGFYLCDGNIDEEVLKRVQSVSILKVSMNKEDILNKLERNKFKYIYVKRCTQNGQSILYNREEIMKDDDYMALILGRRV